MNTTITSSRPNPPAKKQKPVLKSERVKKAKFKFKPMPGNGQHLFNLRAIGQIIEKDNKVVLLTEEGSFFPLTNKNRTAEQSPQLHLIYPRLDKEGKIEKIQIKYSQKVPKFEFEERVSLVGVFRKDKEGRFLVSVQRDMKSVKKGLPKCYNLYLEGLEQYDKELQLYNCYRFKCIRVKNRILITQTPEVFQIEPNTEKDKK